MAVTTAETNSPDRTRRPPGIVLGTILSIVNLIRNLYVHQLYKRDQAEKHARSPSPCVPSTSAMLPPSTGEGHINCTNLFILPVPDHLSYILVRDNRNELLPGLSVLHTPPMPPPPSTGDRCSRSLNIREAVETSTIQRLVASADSRLPLAGGHLLWSKPPSAATTSCIPRKLDKRHPGHSGSLHSTTMLRPSNSGDIGGSAPSSGPNDLPVDPVCNLTIRGSNARNIPRVTSTVPASKGCTPSGIAVAGSLLSSPSSSQQHPSLDPRTQ